MKNYIHEKIKLNYKNLTKKEKEIANNIIKDEINLLSHSITKIASLLNVSPSMINRFVIKLGYEGWKDLIASIKHQNEFKNKYGKILNIMSTDVIYSISLTERNLNYNELMLIVNKIYDVKKVRFFASELAYDICKYYVALFQRINIRCEIIHTMTNQNFIHSDECFVNIFVFINGHDKRNIAITNRWLNKQKFNAMISATRSTNVDNIFNARLHAEFFQSYDIDNVELPIVSKSVIDYIINQIFIHVYNKNPNEFYEIISKTKIV